MNRSVLFVCLLLISSIAQADEALLASKLPIAEGLSPHEAAARMTVPEGFKVQLSAGEPLVHQPVAFTIDRRGRLWVAEAYTYPKRADDGEGKDKIVILEDTDGDGTFEKRKVFIENLNLISGLELGFGGVWVGAAPYLMFIPDENEDDIPDSVAQNSSSSPLAFPKDVPPRSESPARRIRLARYARNTQFLHLGTGWLALRLPRSLHAFQSGCARNA